MRRTGTGRGYGSVEVRGGGRGEMRRVSDENGVDEEKDEWKRVGRGREGFVAGSV
jgi:hypothetical protein